MTDVKEKADRAKVFWSGRSQAVRLPKEYRFDTDEVMIWREGDAVFLKAVPVGEDEWAWLNDLEPFDEDMVEAALDRPKDFDTGRRDEDIELPE
jgi:antitoxin VapB